MESILDPEVILVVINADLPPQKVCMVARSQEDVDYAIAIMRRGLINTQPQDMGRTPVDPKRTPVDPERTPVGSGRTPVDRFRYPRRFAVAPNSPHLIWRISQAWRSSTTKDKPTLTALARAFSRRAIVAVTRLMRPSHLAGEGVCEQQ